MSYAKYKDLGKKNDEKNIEKFSAFEITNQQDKNKFIQTNYICVIDVYGNFCQPCKQISPLFDNLSMKKEYNVDGVIKLAKENVELKLLNPPDANNQPAPRISGVPTFMFFVKGRYFTSITGADINAVENQIIQLLPK